MNSLIYILLSLHSYVISLFNTLYVNDSYMFVWYTTWKYSFIAGAATHYYLGFFKNHASGSGHIISILLTTAEVYPVSYYIEAPGVGYYHRGNVSAGNAVILNLSRSVEVLSQDEQNKGIYITINSDNVTVIGQNLVQYSSDSFFILPIIEVDDAYIYFGISVARTIVHPEPLYSSILIVGTENNILMKLTVTQSVTISVGNVVTNLIPSRQYSFVINRLQTVYIGSVDDLSGTKIITDRPVSVFSGHECGNVPLNVSACSHLIEQIPPTALWGKVYYTAPFAGKRSYTIKVLAAYNLTTVSIYCNNTRKSYIINEGQFINRISQMNEYCAIYSNNKVLLLQLSHGGSENLNSYGDPMMTLVPDKNQYLNQFDFSTIRNPLQLGFNHYVNIIVMAQYYQPNMIYLIGGGVKRSLTTQQWIPIQVNSITEAYATQVRIPEGISHIVHTDPAAQMTVIVYGFTSNDGYGHIGGFRNHTGGATNTGC